MTPRSLHWQQYYSYMLSKPEKQMYLSLRCVCLWEKSEPALVVWARSCQCVLVQSGNMRQNPNRIPTAHFFNSLWGTVFYFGPPLLSHCVSCDWTLCPRGRWSHLRALGCHTLLQWLGPCWCCPPSPFALWYRHAGISWWHLGPEKKKRKHDEWGNAGYFYIPQGILKLRTSVAALLHLNTKSKAVWSHQAPFEP